MGAFIHARTRKSCRIFTCLFDPTPVQSGIKSGLPKSQYFTCLALVVVVSLVSIEVLSGSVTVVVLKGTVLKNRTHI